MREILPVPSPGLDLRHHYGHHQSLAIRAGGLIFCSGMVAVNPETGEREHGTLTSEARRIFENLKLLLESAGSSLDRPRAPETSTSSSRSPPATSPASVF